LAEDEKEHQREEVVEEQAQVAALVGDSISAEAHNVTSETNENEASAEATPLPVDPIVETVE